MNNDPIKLRCGPYVTPIVITDTVVECEVRGLVKIVGQSGGPIPWPIGERDGEQELVVFKALSRALRQESTEAVAAAWGVRRETVEQWKLHCRQPRKRKKQTHKNPPIPWKPAEDLLLSQTSLAEAARLTGRTITAVRKRRRYLGLPDGRMVEQKAQHQYVLADHARAASKALRLRTDELYDSLAELRVTYARAKATVAYWEERASRAPFEVRSVRDAP